jgi:hypothetical protein
MTIGATPDQTVPKDEDPEDPAIYGILGLTQPEFEAFQNSHNAIVGFFGLSAVSEKFGPKLPELFLGKLVAKTVLPWVAGLMAPMTVAFQVVKAQEYVQEGGPYKHTYDQTYLGKLGQLMGLKDIYDQALPPKPVWVPPPHTLPPLKPLPRSFNPSPASKSLGNVGGAMNCTSGVDCEFFPSSTDSDSGRQLPPLPGSSNGPIGGTQDCTLDPSSPCTEDWQWQPPQ